MNNIKNSDNSKKKDEKDEGFDKKKLINSYMKSNYRFIGPLKHSAIKPCHWQEQKLLTGRDNRNCYKGYFGIKSELCIQNTPSLPFCNHQCVFCWRDIENSSFGYQWKGEMDEPKMLVKEMIRHSKNLIFEHFTIKKSLDNLTLMHKILYLFSDEALKGKHINSEFGEMEIAQLFSTTRAKIHRAVLVLKNCKILINPSEDLYKLHDRIGMSLKNHDDVNKIISEEVTTIEDIEKVFEAAKNPKHAAISLAGEPMLFPKIGELVQEFRKRKMSTFIVTNGTFPKVIKELDEKNQLPTQLYVTLPASNKKSFIQISRPLTPNAWENLMKTIKLLPNIKCRTLVRITAVKYLNINIEMAEEYVKILEKSTPNFLELKGFTVEAHALLLEKRLGKLNPGHKLREFAPTFNDLLEFAKKIEELSDFEIIAVHEASRDVLLRGNWPKDKSIELDYSNV